MIATRQYPAYIKLHVGKRVKKFLPVSLAIRSRELFWLGCIIVGCILGEEGESLFGVVGIPGINYTLCNFNTMICNLFYPPPFLVSKRVPRLGPEHPCHK